MTWWERTENRERRFIQETEVKWGEVLETTVVMVQLSGRFGFWFGREGFAQKDVKFPNAQLVWLCCCRFRISPPSHCPVPEIEGRAGLLYICIIGPCFWGGSSVENLAVTDSRKEDTWDTLCSL